MKGRLVGDVRNLFGTVQRVDSVHGRGAYNCHIDGCTSIARVIRRRPASLANAGVTVRALPAHALELVVAIGEEAGPGRL